ncbi:MAG: methyltransferase domain-containing protein [Alcanivoracaceae bacterium]|nr:methyltransferase domain-containing protein [Alcanivoracaceae bacterium]
MANRPERFHIAGDLLAGPHGDSRWNNLGYWESARNYTEACSALAELHGLAANLKPSHRLLELACGYGAALDVWRDRFAVSRVSALEYRPECVSHIRSLPHTAVESVLLGHFDEPLDPGLSDSVFDAVLCVDAAYHASSLRAFIGVAESVLAERGVLVFSTVMLADTRGPESWPRAWFASALLRAAAISPASLPAESDLRRTVEEQGLVVTALEDISAAVFPGFADYVAKRSRNLGWRERYSAGWLKVVLTALWCRRLEKSKKLRYVLVSAGRPENCRK